MILLDSMGKFCYNTSLKYLIHMLDVEIRKLLLANTSIKLHGNNRFGCTIEQLDDRYEVVLSICGDIKGLN